MRMKIALGMIVLVAVSAIAIAERPYVPPVDPIKEPPNPTGPNPMIEIENDTVSFLGWNNQSTWNITITNTSSGFDDTYNGIIDLEIGERYMVVFVVSESLRPAYQIMVPVGIYEAYVNATDIETGKYKEKEGTIIVLPDTEE